jgi:hypothetical protein
VVFKSLNSQPGSTQGKLLGVLSLYGFNKENSTLIFKTVYPDTDDQGSKLYTLETGSDTFTPLTQINQVYFGWGGSVLSPDKRYLAYAPENTKGNTGISQLLYLFDLPNDKIQTIVELGASESFNAGFGYLSSSFEIVWLDDNTIQYSVFEQKEIETVNYNKLLKPLIEKRTYNLK